MEVSPEWKTNKKCRCHWEQKGPLRSLHLSITALTESCPGLGRILLPPLRWVGVPTPSPLPSEAGQHLWVGSGVVTSHSGVTIFSSFHTLGPASGLREPGGGAWCSEEKLAGFLQCYADFFRGPRLWSLVFQFCDKDTPFSQHYSLVSVRASQGELRAPGASQEHGSLSVASGPGPGLPGNPVLQEVFSQGYSEGWS